MQRPESSEGAREATSARADIAWQATQPPTVHSAQVAWALVAAGMAVGCGDASEPQNALVGNQGGTSSAQGGSSASAVGGNAQGGSSTGTLGGATQVGGSSATEVFSSSLPKPSFDCRNATDTKHCISVSGSFGSQQIDHHWSSTKSPTVLYFGPSQWPVGGPENDDINVGYFVDVRVPLSPAGVYLHDSASTPWNGDVHFAIDGVGGNRDSHNFVSARISGSLVTDPATNHDIIAGTFQATWSKPSTTPCVEPSSLATFDYCAEITIHGTYRAEFALKLR